MSYRPSALVLCKVLIKNKIISLAEHTVHSILSLQELKQLRGMIDEDPRLFTAEIILNLLLSYRDIQVWCGWVGWLVCLCNNH